MELFENPYILVAAASVLVVLSYFYSYISEKIRVPSVLLLILTGLGVRFALSSFNIEVPNLRVTLEIFGIIGLILIVLEGSLELRITREKLGVLINAFLSALILLILSSMLVAWVLHQVTVGLSFQRCLVNAIPVAVISSAIAIPSVVGLVEDKREFIVYESIFSDILGILFFNMMVSNPDITLGSAGMIFLDLGLTITVALAFTFILLFLLDRVRLKVRFALIIAVLILLYNFGKMVHLSSLLVILIFGIVLNNLDHIWRTRLHKYFDYVRIQQSIDQFRMITNESAFLIRTFFFFIFGMSFSLLTLLDFKVFFTGFLTVVILYALRYLYLRFFARLKNISAPLLIAPRGLITILLFYSIPQDMLIGVISEGVLFFVILASSLIMMGGLWKGAGVKDMPVHTDPFMLDEEKEQ